MLEARPAPAVLTSPQEVAAKLLAPGADIATELSVLASDDALLLVAGLLKRPDIQSNPALIGRLADQLFGQWALA